MKKTLLALFVLGLVLSAGAYTYLRDSEVAPEVSTVTISQGDIVATVGATGALEAVTTVQVGSQVSGKIQELYADFNSIVRAGEVIARLDPSLFDTQVEQARANLERADAEVERFSVAVDDARTQLTRAEGLAARNLIPETELEAAQVGVRSAAAQLRSSRAQMTQAEASLNQAEVNLEHTIITAPIDGIVISRNVDVGQTVAASMQAPILFLLAADLTKMKVNANIDESDVGRIRPDQVIQFRVDAYPNEEFEGTVSQVRLEPIVVENVVTYATVIDVPNPELKLKPGMTATVTVEIARRNAATRIPNAALRFRPTPEMFAALNLPVPEQVQGGAGGRQGPRGRAEGASAPAGPPRGDASGPGAGGEGGGPRGDPERRQRMMERLQNMSPEDREAAMQRFRGRGGAGGFGQQREWDGGAARGDEPRGDAVSAVPTTERGARTIDALFGPLPPADSRGQVWIYAGGELKPTRLRLGVTDGAFTELLGPEIPAGTELVTNVVTGNEGLSRPVGGARSPLIPQRGRRR